MYFAWTNIHLSLRKKFIKKEGKHKHIEGQKSELREGVGNFCGYAHVREDE